jgi:hypothetical protein
MSEQLRPCVCLIVGQKYSWEYVDRLYSMLCRHSSCPIELHVLTEPNRSVPAPYVKHALDMNPAMARADLYWWYKMQLFNNAKFRGAFMYFDLDLVIADSIDFLWQRGKDFFWAVRDFRYLWRNNSFDINSSIMYYNVDRFYWIWEDFKIAEFDKIKQKYPGDQNYLNEVIPRDHLKFFDTDLVKSWRWEVQDGGWDFRKKRPLMPGTDLVNQAKIMVFHGNPKPHQLCNNNHAVQTHWK